MAALRIFCADTVTALTLRDCYELYLRDGIANRGTLSCYETVLRHWELTFGGLSVHAIDRSTVRTFRTALERRMSPAAVAKNLRHLRAILRRCGPCTDGNPCGAEIVTKIPYVEMPRCPRLLPRVATVAEVDALFRACESATWPQVAGTSPPDLWRAAIACLWNLGPRCFDLWSQRPLDPASAGWKWSRLSVSRGEICFHETKTRNETRLPLHSNCQRLLAACRTDRVSVFPATLARGSLYRQWHRLRLAAGLVGDQGDIEPHDIRRACQTQWDALRFGLGDFVLGHAAHDVGGRHYRNFSALAGELVEQLPQPAAFLDTTHSDHDSPGIPPCRSI